MSVNDMIKKSVLNSFSQYNVPKMALALLVALLVGIVIYCVYRRFYTGVVYSRSFAVTLVGMCVLTCMVTLAISTNIVISLGMVGALSIVRYRTAVKDPMDLLYLFWAITSGIAAGAGMSAGARMFGRSARDRQFAQAQFLYGMRNNNEVLDRKTWDGMTPEQQRALTALDEQSAQALQKVAQTQAEKMKFSATSARPDINRVVDAVRQQIPIGRA